MILRFQPWIPGTAILLCLLFAPAVSRPLAADLRIEIFPRKFYPGQAVLIRMSASCEITSVHGALKEQEILFRPAPDRKSWIGLAGLDLDVSPGVGLITYAVAFAGGFETKGTYGLDVLAKTFPVERITVDEKYVHLSKKDLARYRREQKILSAIFGRQSREGFWQDPFAVPVDVSKGSRFGLRRIINGETRNPHSGADLRAGPGTPVKAANAGRVVFADDLFFSGNTVILDHGGGLYTLYAHLDKITTAKDRVVMQGEIIGRVGATGRVTGPHLHWAAKLNGARVDPFSLVSLPLLPVQSREDPESR